MGTPQHDLGKGYAYEYPLKLTRSGSYYTRLLSSTPNADLENATCLGNGNLIEKRLDKGQWMHIIHNI